MEASCAELLRRVTQRDHAALGELYDQLAGPVYSFALQTLADRREAEEVVQDVFLQIWNKAATFDGALGTVFNWALGITRNRCIDYLRSRQRRTKLLDHATEEAGVESVQAVKDTLSGEELAAVRSAVESLPPDQHQAIALAFFGGLTHQEIAETLNEPLGTIKARIRRGMLKLRDSLQDFL